CTFRLHRARAAWRVIWITLIRPTESVGLNRVDAPASNDADASMRSRRNGRNVMTKRENGRSLAALEAEVLPDAELVNVAGGVGGWAFGPLMRRNIQINLHALPPSPGVGAPSL